MLSPRKYHPNLSKATRRENHVIFGRRTLPTKATVSTSEIKVRASGQKYTGNDGKKYTVCSPGWRTGHVRECIRTGTPRVDPTSSGQNSNGKVNISANVGRQRRRDRGSGSHQELHPIPLAAHRRRSLCPIYQHAIPPLAAIDSITIAPLAHIVESVPFLSLILFLVLSLGTRGANLSRPIRFNAQQAVLIDVALVFPELIGSAFEGQRQFQPLMEPSSNFIFYCYMGACLYSITSNLRGKTPDGIPFISNAAQQATGPF